MPAELKLIVDLVYEKGIAGMRRDQARHQVEASKGLRANMDWIDTQFHE